MKNSITYLVPVLFSSLMFFSSNARAKEIVDLKVGGTAEGEFVGASVGYYQSHITNIELGIYGGAAKGNFNDLRNFEVGGIRGGSNVQAKTKDVGVNLRYFPLANFYLSAGIGYQFLEGSSESFATGKSTRYDNEFHSHSVSGLLAIGMRTTYKSGLMLGIEALEARAPIVNSLKVTGPEASKEDTEWVLDHLNSSRVGFFPKILVGYKF